MGRVKGRDWICSSAGGADELPDLMDVMEDEDVTLVAILASESENHEI